MKFTGSPDWMVLSWFALAAVSGAIGGCSAAALTSLRARDKMFKAFQALAYTVIGATAGMIVFVLGPLVGDVYSTEQLAKEALVAGVVVPVLVAAQNLASKIILRYFGLEVQITLRKDHEETRREGDKK